MSEKSLSSLRRLKNDPLYFVRTIWGVEPTDQQCQLLNAVAPRGSHTSAASGHGIGKSTGFAWLAQWFVGTRTDCRVPCTAPSKTQLYDVLWAEIAKWYHRMPPEWRNSYRLTKDHLMLVGAEQSSFAVARTSRKEKPEAFQGLHAKEMLFLIDEASGVDDTIFAVAEGALSTRGARVAMASNPTRTSGFFYNSHHSDKHIWTHFNFSCLDSPLADPLYIERARKKYGENSAFYMVRVLGQFPGASADQFIPLSLLEEATRMEWLPDYPSIWGLDPAYFGDNSTALAKRAGPVILPLKSIQGMDTMQIVGWVLHEWRETPEKERPEVIVVDATGVGAGVADRLRELHYPVISVNFSSRPANSQQWGNLRTEIWAMVRERLEARLLKLPDDDRLLGEGSSARYTFDSLGRLILENKKDARNRGVDSPDHMDAVALTFYNEPAFGSVFGLTGGFRDIKVETEYDPFGDVTYQ